MLFLRSSILVLLIFVFSSFGLCQEICFTYESAVKLESDLKNCEYDQLELKKRIEEKELLEQEIQLLKQKIELQNQLIQATQQTLNQYEQLIRYQKEAYEDIIRKNQPSLYKKIFDSLGFIGLGVIIGLIF